MKRQKTPSAEDLIVAEALREIDLYCKEYETENKKCVSYYMLATYAYEEKKETWIALLKNRVHRSVIAWTLKSIRAERRRQYGVPQLEAMEQYYKARERYELSKIAQWEEEVHAEHERELREKEHGETN